MSASNIQIVRHKNARKRMGKEMLEEFCEVLRLPSTSENDKMVSLYVCKYIERKGLEYKIDEVGNIIVHKGDGVDRPCFVCHLDTVQPYKPITLETYEHEGHVYVSSKQGVGGDDKCGVWVCLRLLDLPNVSIVFFAKEEMGCDGSNDVDLSEFDECNAIIGVDRWGNNDYVNMYYGEKTTSDEFDDHLSELLSAYGYKPAHGLLTDSLNLFDRGVYVPCINLSCGYYAHHTLEEYIDTNETLMCLQMCQKIATLINGVHYEYIPMMEVDDDDTLFKDMPKSTVVGEDDEFDYDLDYNRYDGYGVCESCGLWEKLSVWEGMKVCEFCRPVTRKIKEISY